MKQHVFALLILFSTGWMAASGSPKDDALAARSLVIKSFRGILGYDPSDATIQKKINAADQGKMLTCRNAWTNDVVALMKKIRDDEFKIWESKLAQARAEGETWNKIQTEIEGYERDRKVDQNQLYELREKIKEADRLMNEIREAIMTDLRERMREPDFNRGPRIGAGVRDLGPVGQMAAQNLQAPDTPPKGDPRALRDEFDKEKARLQAEKEAAFAAVKEVQDHLQELTALAKDIQASTTWLEIDKGLEMTLEDLKVKVKSLIQNVEAAVDILSKPAEQGETDKVFDAVLKLSAAFKDYKWVKAYKKSILADQKVSMFQRFDKVLMLYSDALSKAEALMKKYSAGVGNALNKFRDESSRLHKTWFTTDRSEERDLLQGLENELHPWWQDCVAEMKPRFAILDAAPQAEQNLLADTKYFDWMSKLWSIAEIKMETESLFEDAQNEVLLASFVLVRYIERIQEELKETKKSSQEMADSIHAANETGTQLNEKKAKRETMLKQGQLQGAQATNARDEIKKIEQLTKENNDVIKAAEKLKEELDKSVEEYDKKLTSLLKVADESKDATR